MDKLLNFYSEISALLGRQINKMDGALIDENFHTLTAEQQAQLRLLLDELMGDRNGLFPDGFGADSVDIGAIPNVTLPPWRGAKDTETEDAIPSHATINDLAVEQHRAADFWTDRLRVTATPVRQLVVAEQGVEYGTNTALYTGRARAFLQRGDRLWSEHAKRLPARALIRKRSAFLQALRAFQTQVGFNFERLAPELGVALQQLDRKVQEGGRRRPNLATSRAATGWPTGALRRANGSAKKAAKF